MSTMHPAFQHFVLLLCAATFSAIGWFTADNPSKAYRFFTFGIMPVPERGFAIGFLKVVGWVFAVSYGAGTLVYCFLIASDLLR